MKTDPLAQKLEGFDDQGSPESRVLDDFFKYQDRYLDDLGFNEPIDYLGTTSARRELAELWQSRERRAFPNPGATHTLAVLYYWEARASGRNGPQLPTAPDTIDRLWTEALVRFAALSASDTFWSEWGVLTGNSEIVAGGSIALALAERIEIELSTIATRLREMGDHPAATRFEIHLSRFEAELEAARHLPPLRILSGRGLSPAAIVAGPHLLEEVGMLTKVRDAIASQHPETLSLFERYSFIDHLLTSGRYETALHALEQIDPVERAKPQLRTQEIAALREAAGLAIRACMAEDAVHHWERLVRMGEDPAGETERIATLATARAEELVEEGESGAAIDLLEPFLLLGPSTAIPALLGALLFRRGSAWIDAASAESGAEERTEADREVIRKGVEDLERAATLDPGNAEIASALERARGVQGTTGGPVPSAPGLSVPGPALGGSSPAPTDGKSRPDRLSRVSLSGEKGAGLRFYLGAALWFGITLLIAIAYPLLLPRTFGVLGILIAFGLAAVWVLANVVGFVAIRSGRLAT
jgi:tetratricopeptide (TPR) repeat protein